MKHSNFALAILSAIILSACGSSSSNDNQSVDPTPSPTPNQNSNSNPTPTPTPAKPISPAANPNPESIPQQQSSSNANNNQPISSQTTPIVKAKPNPKTAGGSKQKQNKGQGNTPAAGKNPIKTSDLTGLAAKPEAELKKLLDEAIKAESEASTKKITAAGLVSGLPNQISGAKTALTNAANAVDQAVKDLKATPDEAHKKELAKKLVDLEVAKENLQELTDKFEQAKKDVAEQTALETVAGTEKNAYKNALAAQKAEKEDPEAVIEAKKANAESLKLKAEKEAAEGNKDALDAEVAAIKEQVKALEEKNKANKKVTSNQDTPTDVKEKLEAETKANDEKIAQLKKDQKEKEEAVKAADKKAKLIKVDADAAQTAANEANKAAAYRGIYASTGTYDESSSYKSVKKVTATNSVSNDDKWMMEWTLFIKDGDKEVQIDVNDLKSKKSFKDPSGTGITIVGYFDESNKLFVNQGQYFIQGHIDDKNFFNAGLVTPDEKIEQLTTASFTRSFGSTKTSANKAFLRTTDGKPFMASITNAKADFGNREFKGVFGNFREYNLEWGTNGSLGSAPTGLPATVDFVADIKGNKFVPKAGQPSNNAKVYGYFYGPNVEEAGGLVEHDKFNGTFGVRNN